MLEAADQNVVLADGGSGLRRGVRSVGVVAVAVTGASVLNGVLQLALAHVLAPRAYSELALLFAVLTLCAVPMLALQATVARAVAGRVADAAAIARGAALTTLRWTVPLTLLAAAVVVPVARELHLARPLAVVLALATLAAGAAVPTAWGALQGAGRFGALAAAQLSWAALRLVLGLAAGAAGLGVVGILGGVAVATAAALAVALALLRVPLHAPRRQPVRLLSGYSGGAAVGLSCFTALGADDVVAARLALPHHAAGAYAAGSVAARTLTLGAVVVTTVAFPRVAAAQNRLRERRYLTLAAGAVAAIGVVGVVAAVVAGGPLLSLGFGHGYAAAKSYLPILLTEGALLGVVYVYLFHFLALGRSRYAVLVACALALQLVGFAVLHGDGRQLALVQAGVAAVLVVASEAFDRTARA